MIDKPYCVMISRTGEDDPSEHRFNNENEALTWARYMCDKGSIAEVYHYTEQRVCKKVCEYLPSWYVKPIIGQMVEPDEYSKLEIELDDE